MPAELSLDAVLEKTAKGRDELATRAHHLQPGQRNLLILADGQRPVRELLKAGVDPQRCLQALQGLIDDGFLAFSSALPAAASAPASAAVGPAQASPAAEPAATSPAAQARLIALVEEQFGAQAPRLVQKIMQYPDTAEGCAAAVQACVRFIRLFIDEKQADVFAQRAQEVLPR